MGEKRHIKEKKKPKQNKKPAKGPQAQVSVLPQAPAKPKSTSQDE